MPPTASGRAPRRRCRCRTSSSSAAEIAILWQASPGPTLTRLTARTQTTAIWIEDDGVSGASAVIEQCAVRDNLASGIVVTNRVSALVRRSHIIHNRWGVEARSGSSLRFENNVVAANWEFGLALTQTATNAMAIFNNTFDKNVADVRTSANPATSPGIGIWVKAATSPSAFIVRNNLVTSHGTAGIRVDGATQPVLDHNDAWGNGTNYQGTTGGVGAISASPLYVDPVAPTGTWEFGADARSWTDSGSLAFTYDHEDGRAVLLRARFGTSFIYDATGSHDALQFFDRADNNLGAQYGSFAGASPITVPGTFERMRYYDDGAAHTGNVNLQGYEIQQLKPYNYRLQPSSLAIDVGSDSTYRSRMATARCARSTAT